MGSLNMHPVLLCPAWMLPMEVPASPAEGDRACDQGTEGA